MPCVVTAHAGREVQDENSYSTVSIAGLRYEELVTEDQIAKYGSANAGVDMAARAPGAPVQDDASLIPFQLRVVLHLLSGFTSVKAKSRPVIVLFFSLVACFLGNPALANISSMWFTVFSGVFVWMLTAVHGAFAESRLRTAVVVFFDYGCAVFIFIVYSEMPNRSSVPAVFILVCGIIQILHLVYFAAVLIFALFYSVFRWCVPAGHGNRGAPALNQIAPALQPEL